MIVDSPTGIVPSVIDRAVRTLRAFDGVASTPLSDTDRRARRDSEGFVVRLRMVHDRKFVVSTTPGSTTFDRAEDAYDCFEYGLSESCRLKITLRGDEPSHLARRKAGVRHVGARPPAEAAFVAFWKPARVDTRQNHVFPREP